MKKYILFLLLPLILFAGCSKPRFTVEFELPAELHAAYTLSYYASSSTQGKWIETGVMLQDGKSKTVLPISNPAVVAISVAGSNIYFYAEKGDKIKIKGENADVFSWTIGGNGINDDWSKWRKENAAMLSSRDASKINEAVKKYVEQHNDKPLATLLLLYEFDRRQDNTLFLKLWKSLKGDAAKEKWISLSGRSDIYTNTPLDSPDLKKKHMLALKSIGNGADTIITGKVPVVLLFWRNSDSGRMAMIDSLRALRKAHPDSASFIIADICFDADSISWASPLGRDSLQHTIRAWNPVAEADSAIRALGIERTPTLITISPNR